MVLSLLNVAFVFTQESDSSFTSLNEIVVTAKPVLDYNNQTKPLSSLDEYMEKMTNVGLIKRGNYAWEPMLNSMSSERIAVTIDGMHIFGACTDKMDPVTSYVEISNLKEVNVLSGQSGASSRPSIGGSVDLVRNCHEYISSGWSGAVNFGVESNASLVSTGAKVKYANHLFFTEANFMFRNADNYKAGKNTLVNFSQFTKHNASLTAGLKIAQNQTLTGSFIIDNATNVGYPALPMDVALARAFITSLEHTAKSITPAIESWNTKVYFNTLKHIMDDTKRPNVAIHMDMPGKSETYGLLSNVTVNVKKHKLILGLSSYYNRSIAEMTMYSKNPLEKPMFMYTWPDIRTYYFGLNAKDHWMINAHHHLNYSLHAGIQQNRIANKSGLQSLDIFYPNTSANKNRFLYGLQAGYTFEKNGFEVSFGSGYGERAPSVSEGYGFYLFNSFDKYDYIGNPNLKNEKSVDANIGFVYRNNKVKVNVNGNYFHIFNYIIGTINPVLSPMTIGATGVRQYTQLPFAHIANSNLEVSYKPIWNLGLKAFFSYSYGTDNKQEYLPLIRPFSFRFNATYAIKNFDFEVATEGATKHYAYSKNYGETPTTAYAILNLSAGYKLLLSQHQLYVKVGVENVADTYYTTYADWNHIPRRGRNFFVSISFVFDKTSRCH